MELKFSFEDVLNFFKSQGLTLCDYEGEELSAYVEDFNMGDNGYVKNVFIKDSSSERIFKCSLMVQNDSLIVIQEKGSKESKKTKVYGLDEKWQTFLLKKYGWEYGRFLIFCARKNKKKIFHEFLLLENDKYYNSSRSELARRLAVESKKEILAFSILGKENAENEMKA